MEEKSSIKKIYINKIKEIKKHNEIYFSKNKSLITDKEYDELNWGLKTQKTISPKLKLSRLL